MGRVGFRGRTRRYAFLLIRARSGVGVAGAIPHRRPAGVIFWRISSATAPSCSRSVRLCYKNARSVTSGREYDFTKNGQPTILPKKAGVSIGQRTHLSAGDIAAARAMYP